MDQYNYIYSVVIVALAIVGIWYQWKNQSSEKENPLHALDGSSHSVNIYIAHPSK